MPRCAKVYVYVLVCWASRAPTPSSPKHLIQATPPASLCQTKYTHCSLAFLGTGGRLLLACHTFLLLLPLTLTLRPDPFNLSCSYTHTKQTNTHRPQTNRYKMTTWTAMGTLR